MGLHYTPGNSSETNVTLGEGVRVTPLSTIEIFLFSSLISAGAEVPVPCPMSYVFQSTLWPCSPSSLRSESTPISTSSSSESPCSTMAWLW